MKRSIAGIFFLLVWTGFASCRKNNATEGKACIERLVLLPGDLPVDAPPIIVVDPITEGQIDTIKMLFTNNGLPFGQYQYVYYIYQPWSADSIQQQTTANPFINGLPAFGDQQVFNFINGILSASTSYLMVEVPPDNDTTGGFPISVLFRPGQKIRSVFGTLTDSSAMAQERMRSSHPGGRRASP